MTSPWPIFGDILGGVPPAPDWLLYPKDYEFSCQFLQQYSGASGSFLAYRRDIERLLQWSHHVKKPLATLNRFDVERYILFFQNPPTAWIGKRHVARFCKDGSYHPEWRPFVRRMRAPPARASVAALLAIGRSFFQFLMDMQYVACNPFAQLRQKSKFLRKQQTLTVTRRLTPEQFGWVVSLAENKANLTATLSAERALFLLSIFYGLYLRISEVVASGWHMPVMSDFLQDSDQRWWFRAIGKGNKERLIAVNQTVLKALIRYRTARQLLPALPIAGDHTPLVTRLNSHQAVTSTRQIRNIIQTCFEDAIAALKAQNQPTDALEAATVHWLRHTGISDDVLFRPKDHVRIDAGHGSSMITDRYINVLQDARHDSKQQG
jgi:site-specific recombinase XerD